MTYQVRILRRAQGDLVEIHRYVCRDRPAAAEKLVERLLVAIEGLAISPGRGARPRDERLRRLGFRFVVESPYLVFYKVLNRQVRVYRVVHGKRAYQNIL